MAQLAKTLETVCTQACLEKEKRPDLLLVAKHYSLDVPTAGNSQNIKQKLILLNQ